MKVKYSNNSTRWEVILFSYEDNIPQKSQSKVNVFSGNKGVTSINISRSKSSVQNAASIQVVGDLSPAYAIGNWVIIKSKIGKFSDTEKDKDFKNVSPLKEGRIRFIGQVTTIENSYAVEGSGLLIKRATVHIREWSSVLNIPVRIDANAMSEQFFKTSNVVGRAGLLQSAIRNNGSDIDIGSLASDTLDPFISASLVLAIVGGLNTDKETGVDLGPALGKYEALISLSTLISRMPKLPKELISYLKMPSSVNADRPFSTGFVNTLVGVMQKSQLLSPVGTTMDLTGSMKKYGKESLDKGAFDGYFSSYNDLKKMFFNYQDRPVTSNFLASLSQGVSAWSLIQQQLDLTTNEAFTDIWYFKANPDSEEITSLPVIVLRDKPFALKSLLQSADNPIKNTHWTAYDDVPRIFINDVYIQSVNTSNSFFNSPNYISPQFYSGEVGSVRGDSPQAQYALAVHRIIDNPAIDRFGTIEHYWSTIYSSPTSKQTGKGDIVFVDWFDDAKKLMYYWHTLNYRFGSASLALKDNDLPIMVGCNVSFALGENVLCGHVESASWSFNIGMDGLATTATNVQLSYLCRVKDDSSLGLVGPLGFTNLMDKDLVSPSVESTMSLPEVKQESFIDKLLPKLNLPKLPKVPF